MLQGPPVAEAWPHPAGPSLCWLEGGECDLGSWCLALPSLDLLPSAPRSGLFSFTLLQQEAPGAWASGRGSLAVLAFGMANSHILSCWL